LIGSSIHRSTGHRPSSWPRRSSCANDATCSWCAPLRLGEPNIAIGYAVLKADFQVLYCSVFELVRELQSYPTSADAQRRLARYLKPDLLCLDDSGMKSFPPKGAEAFLEIIVRRHRNRSTLMTSNRPIEEWRALLGHVPAATCDPRLVVGGGQNGRMQGRSYRLRNAAMMAGVHRKAAPRRTRRSPSRRTLGPPPAAPLMGPQSYAAGRYRPIAVLRPATALPPSGTPPCRRRTRSDEGAESRTENH